MRLFPDSGSLTSGTLQCGQTWSIVLAGGTGSRMRPLIRRWLGYAKPKQYCTFTGSRSMLEHTWDRATQLVPPSRLFTIIGKGHGKYLDGDARSIPGRILEQPRNLGTAPGIFLPVSYIAPQDPEATLLIFPSDHFLFPEARFLSHIRHAIALTREFPEKLVLLGAKPDRAETDYGWVRSRDEGALESTGFGPVSGFIEKPGKRKAEQLLQEGCLWNTMICVVKLPALWELGRRFLPLTTNLFRQFCQLLPDLDQVQDRNAALSELYSLLNKKDFSRDILQTATDSILVCPLKDVRWCDWGRPERIVHTLAGLQAKPRFPLTQQEVPQYN